MPPYDGDEFQRFARYTRAFVLSIQPLVSTDLLGFEDWLEKTSYSLGRKQYLRMLRARKYHMKDETIKSQSFLKWEGYLKAKPPRGINSPKDFSKTIAGPVIKAIEKKFFAMKYFVKNSLPETWPDRMWELFGERPVLETDFKSFEAHHRDKFAKLFAFFVSHMLRGAGVSQNVRRLIARMIVGVNVCSFDELHVEVRDRLMSGVVWTSLQNSFLNFCLMSYLAMLTRFDEPSEHIAEIDDVFFGLIEGDDGICLDVGQSIEPAQRLGCLLSFDRQENFGMAKFCGVTCDPLERIVVINPLKVLRTFFVLEGRYESARENTHLRLLRAKALSYLYLFRDCPVVGPLAYKVCQLTSGFDVRAISSGSYGVMSYLVEAQKAKPWLKDPVVTPNSRLVVERKYGLDVGQQIYLEQRISAMTRDGCEVLLSGLVAFGQPVETADDIRLSDHFLGCSYLQGEMPKKIADIMANGLGRALKRADFGRLGLSRDIGQECAYTEVPHVYATLPAQAGGP